MTTFAKRLKAARKAAGLSQKEAAFLANRKQSNWSAMERGIWAPDVAYKKAVKQMEVIALAVGSTPEDLVGPIS